MKVKARDYLEIEYNPESKNWDEVINKELNRLGIQHGQVTVICRPAKRIKSDIGSETLQVNRAAGGQYRITKESH